MNRDASSMRPFVVKDLVHMVMDRKNLSFDDAVSYLYSSDLYLKILDEDMRMWYYSTFALYDMLEEEKCVKRRKNVSEKKLMFRIFCIESYCDKFDMHHEYVLALFRQFGVFGFLDEAFEMLHTQDEEYIVVSIDKLIKNKRRRGK